MSTKVLLIADTSEIGNADELLEAINKSRYNDTITVVGGLRGVTEALNNVTCISTNTLWIGWQGEWWTRDDRAAILSTINTWSPRGVKIEWLPDNWFLPRNTPTFKTPEDALDWLESQLDS